MQFIKNLESRQFWDVSRKSLYSETTDIMQRVTKFIEGETLNAFHRNEMSNTSKQRTSHAAAT